MITTILAFAALANLKAVPLTASAPIVIPGPAGKFDFMNVDPINGFVLACHPGNKALAVLNLKTGQAHDVALGTEVNGACADPKSKRVYAAGPGQTLVSVNMSTWKVAESHPLTGPGDCVQYDAKRGLVYVDNDDGTNLWAFSAKPLKLKATVTIHEAPEYMEIDANRDVIYQAIKSTSTVQVVDLKTMAVKAEWKLGELTGPHGLAFDAATGRIFVAGKNGKLVSINTATGKIVAALDVSTGSDQIAYDAKLRRIYIPSQGILQVVEDQGDVLKIIGSVPVNKDCKRVTVNPLTHELWVAFNDGTHSCFQKFSAN